MQHEPGIDRKQTHGLPHRAGKAAAVARSETLGGMVEVRVAEERVAEERVRAGGLLVLGGDTERHEGAG